MVISIQNQFSLNPMFYQVCQIGQVKRNLRTEVDVIEQDITKMLQNTRYCVMKKEGKTIDIEKEYTIKSESQEPHGKDCESCYDDEHETRTENYPQAGLKCFVPRPDKEIVKNCTQLDKKLIENIIQKVAAELLSRPGDERNVELREQNGVKMWNKGGINNKLNCDGPFSYFVSVRSEPENIWSFRSLSLTLLVVLIMFALLVSYQFVVVLHKRLYRKATAMF